MNFKQDIILEKYLKSIECFPLLTAKREKELSRIILNSKNKDAILRARNEIIEGNLRMVVKLAAELYSRIEGIADINISLLDLIQAGNIALLRAAELFSYKKNCKFCSYAYPTINRKMKRAIKESHFVRIPMHHFKYIARLKEIDGRENKEAVTDKEIQSELNLTDDMFEMIKREKYQKFNIEENELRMESLVNEDEMTLDKKIGISQLKYYLYEKMRDLKPFDRDVLFYKFFGNEELSSVAIGKKYGVSRERVRIAIRSALRRLRIKIEEDRAKGNSKLKKTNKGYMRNKL